MIISKTPFRVSLFGGGTDYPKWYHEHGGIVVGAAINKHCYLSVNRLEPFFNTLYRIIWSKVENVSQIQEIEHPAARAILDTMGFHDESLEISYRADLPACSGLGTSSAFTVGLLNSLHTLRRRQPLHRERAKHDLASEAINIEQNIIKEAVGSQDQVWAAYGGFNAIEFHRGGDFTVEKMKRKNQKLLEQNIMLFFTGFTRTAWVLAQHQIDNVDKSKVLLNEMASICRDARQVLDFAEDPVPKVAHLLRESWARKKRLADGITSPEIDSIYETGRGAGALAGKLLGAGGGGFMLFLVQPDTKLRVKAALKNLIHVPIQFDEIGSQIILNTQND